MKQNVIELKLVSVAAHATEGSELQGYAPGHDVVPIGVIALRGVGGLQCGGLVDCEVRARRLTRRWSRPLRSAEALRQTVKCSIGSLCKKILRIQRLYVYHLQYFSLHVWDVAF